MILPVGDVNPTRRTPVLTIALLVTNAAVFFGLQPHDAGCAELRFLYQWAAVPRELLTLQQIDPQAVPAGLIAGPVAECLAGMGNKSILLSAVTAMFLHANLAHLVGNLLYLWVFGDNVEDRLGHVRFALFYVAGGLGATYAFAALHPDEVTPLLGASGAIAAVLGAYFVLHPRARVRTYVPFPLYLLAPLLGARIVFWFLLFAIIELQAFLVLGLWFGLQVVASASPTAGGGVAYQAHVAGFVAGLLLLLLLDRPRRARTR